MVLPIGKQNIGSPKNEIRKKFKSWKSWEYRENVFNTKVLSFITLIYIIWKNKKKTENTQILNRNDFKMFYNIEIGM